jgi:hypothetical protein
MSEKIELTDPEIAALAADIAQSMKDARRPLLRQPTPLAYARMVERLCIIGQQLEAFLDGNGAAIVSLDDPAAAWVQMAQLAREEQDAIRAEAEAEERRRAEKVRRDPMCARISGDIADLFAAMAEFDHPSAARPASAEPMLGRLELLAGRLRERRAPIARRKSRRETAAH